MLKVIRNYNLSDIKESILLLLDRAAKSFEVRQHAVEITSDAQDKIAAIYDWVKSSVSYVPDPIGASGKEIELFISPVRMVQDHKQGLKIAGDCDDHALLSTSLFRALGIPSNVVLIDSAGNGLDHAYCKAWSEKLGHWVNVDTANADVPLGWHYSTRQEIVV